MASKPQTSGEDPRTSPSPSTSGDTEDSQLSPYVAVGGYPYMGVRRSSIALDVLTGHEERLVLPSSARQDIHPMAHISRAAAAAAAARLQYDGDQEQEDRDILHSASTPAAVRFSHNSLGNLQPLMPPVPTGPPPQPAAAALPVPVSPLPLPAAAAPPPHPAAAAPAVPAGPLPLLAAAALPVPAAPLPLPAAAAPHVHAGPARRLWQRPRLQTLRDELDVELGYRPAFDAARIRDSAQLINQRTGGFLNLQGKPLSRLRQALLLPPDSGEKESLMRAALHFLRDHPAE